MSDRGFIYILLAKAKGHRATNLTQQLSRLGMSVFSLRKWWDGPIAVLTDCSGLPAKVQEECEMVFVDEESWNVLKCKISNLSPFEKTVYLDNDTIVVGDVTPLFPEGEELVTTSWTRSDSRRSSRRFSPWVDDGRLHLQQWEKLRDAKVPLFNTGVFGITKGFTLAKEWQAYTDWFNEDEIALQMLMFGRTGHRDMGDKFNYQVALWRRIKGPLPTGVKLWHYIGGYVRPINPLYCAVKQEMADKGWLDMTELDRRFASASQA